MTGIWTDSGEGGQWLDMDSGFIWPRGVWGLAVAGKLASGKDTVAQAVMDALGALSPERHTWADAIKDELDTIMSWCRDERDDAAVFARLDATGVSPSDAARLVETVRDDVAAGRNARDRTDSIRAALQILGTDIRRASDPDYWVRQAIAAAQVALEDGRSVFFTDCRFPNEIVAARSLGIYTVRLEVASETQAQRLWERDGALVDPVAQRHHSETALDGYAGFDLVVDNNGSLDETVEIVYHAMRARRSLRS